MKLPRERMQKSLQTPEKTTKMRKRRRRTSRERPYRVLHPFKVRFLIWRKFQSIYKHAWRSNTAKMYFFNSRLILLQILLILSSWSSNTKKPVENDESTKYIAKLDHRDGLDLDRLLFAVFTRYYDLNTKDTRILINTLLITAFYTYGCVHQARVEVMKAGVTTNYRQTQEESISPRRRQTEMRHRAAMTFLVTITNSHLTSNLTVKVFSSYREFL